MSKITHDFARRLFPSKDTVPDSIEFDTDSETFLYDGKVYTLYQMTTAINALEDRDRIANTSRQKRARKRGAPL